MRKYPRVASVQDSQFQRGPFQRGLWFGLLMAAVFCLALGGCMQTGEHDVNTELFSSQEEMVEKSAQLKPGMSKKKVFEILGVSPDRFEVMSAERVQMCLYGNSQVQGSPAQLEVFRQKLNKMEGYSLPYREIKSNSSLGFGKMKIEKTGYDLRLLMVFDRNKLLKSAIEGTHQVKHSEDQYLWDTLIRRGIGLAF